MISEECREQKVLDVEKYDIELCNGDDWEGKFDFNISMRNSRSPLYQGICVDET